MLDHARVTKYVSMVFNLWSVMEDTRQQNEHISRLRAGSSFFIAGIRERWNYHEQYALL